MFTSNAAKYAMNIFRSYLQRSGSIVNKIFSILVDIENILNI